MAQAVNRLYSLSKRSVVCFAWRRVEISITNIHEGVFG